MILNNKQSFFTYEKILDVVQNLSVALNSTVKGRR